MNRGLVSAALAFGFWGLFPLYFLTITTVPPLEVVLQRSVWSLLFLFAILGWQRRWDWLAEAFRHPKTILRFVLSALLLAANWLVYVWSVQAGHVLEASLGYFINPLLNVLLGVLVLRERLRAVQWTAVAMAASGVAWMTWQTGRLPWVALVLAGSFALYGLLRKTATLGALEGLALENLVLAPLSVPALAWWTLQHDGVLLRGDPVLIGWLVLGGPLTALPLLFFADAARRLSLATLGLMQYLGPSLQFVLALTVFHEAFDRHRLIGFVLIWLALALVSTDALLRRDRGHSHPDCDSKLHPDEPGDDAVNCRTDSPPAARSSG